MRKALIRELDGFVENIIEIDFPNTWQPPKDCYCVDALDASPGDTWDGTKFIKPAPIIPQPPRSGHPAQLVGVTPTAARPARVKRVWGGRDYFYNCLATETVVAEYQAGKIVNGDWLWVEFLDPSEEIGGGEQIVVGKVFKSW